MDFIFANIDFIRVTLRWETCFNCSGSFVALVITSMTQTGAGTNVYVDIMGDLACWYPAAATLRSPLRTDTLASLK